MTMPISTLPKSPDRIHNKRISMVTDKDSPPQRFSRNVRTAMQTTRNSIKENKHLEGRKTTDITLLKTPPIKDIVGC